ncbi:hypothetical protein FRC01_000866 [Tulasnella sp. 417]|nr:hypothetical protein FRC01_000866 [Tulasnella sp. 417]
MYSFCETPEYMYIAPELLENQGYTKTVDWRRLGVLLYEMMTGLPPFYDETCPRKRLIMTSLLLSDPSRRLGNRGAEEIKAHPFFARHINWETLVHKKITPPFKPSVTGQIDVSNFDSEFTSEAPMDSVVTDSALSEAPMDSVVTDSALSEKVQDQFNGFTCIPRTSTSERASRVKASCRKDALEG